MSFRILYTVYLYTCILVYRILSFRIWFVLWFYCFQTLLVVVQGHPVVVVVVVVVVVWWIYPMCVNF